MPTYDLKQYQIMLNKMTDDLWKAVDEGAESAGLKIVEYIQTSVIPATQPMPVDRGLYRAGWKSKKIKRGVYVYNRVAHASFVEYGVKRVAIGPKLINALAAWVRRKGIGSRVVTSKNGKSRIIKPSAQRAKEIAYAIAVGAKKKGGFFNSGRGMQVFRRSLRVAGKIFTKEVNAAIKKRLGK